MTDEWIPVPKPPLGKVRDLNQEVFDNLKCNFARKIFVRGLYAVADDSDKKTLTSTVDGVYIGTLWMCGRLMITISHGSENTEEYRQITFMCSSDDPMDLFVKSYEGTYQELEELISKASERFTDLKSITGVMKHDSVIFAGIAIGDVRD